MLITLFRTLGRWPLPALHALGWLGGWLVWLASPTYRRRWREHTRRAALRGWARWASVGAAGQQVAELLHRCWSPDLARVQRLREELGDEVKIVAADASLAALCAGLTARGGVPEKDAHRAAVDIEKTDIAGREEAIRATRSARLKRLQANLLRASLRHLKAFEADLEGQRLHP